MRKLRRREVKSLVRGHTAPKAPQRQWRSPSPQAQTLTRSRAAELAGFWEEGPSLGLVWSGQASQRRRGLSWVLRGGRSFRVSESVEGGGESVH